jgi:hypothetical protein
MLVLAPTKRQKNAARRAAKKQAALAFEKAPPSGVEYTLVGIISPEQFETSDISCNSAALSLTIMDFKRPRFNSGLPIAPTIANPALTVSQALWPQKNISFGFETPSTSPSLTALSMESLDNFDDSFTFETPTPTLSGAKAPGFFAIPSCRKSIDDIHRTRTTSLTFSEKFVDELSRSNFTTAEASSQAFEEALSQIYDTPELTIFTRLRPAESFKAPSSVYIPKYTFKTFGKKEEGCSLMYARSAYGPWPPLQHPVQPHVTGCVETTTIRILKTCQPLDTT